MAKTSNSKQAQQKSSGGGKIVGLAILLVAIGAALWVRNHFTANAASFATYMDGVKSMQAGREQEAVATWEDLLVKDPTFPDTYAALATYYNNQGEAQHSLELLDKAKEEHIDTPDLTLARAEAYGRLSDKRCMAVAKEAVKLLPDNYRSHLAMSTAYAQVYDESHAMQELHKAQQLSPNDAVLYLLGAEYTSAVSDYAQVEEQARKAVAINPNLAEGWYYVGWAIASGPSQDRLPEARKALEQATKLNPSAFSPWLQLGDTCWRLHDIDAAVKALETARSLGAKPLPGGIVTQEHLQDRIKTAHLLLEAYHSRNDSANEARIRAEVEQLSAQIQKQIHHDGLQK